MDSVKLWPLISKHARICEAIATVTTHVLLVFFPSNFRSRLVRFLLTSQATLLELGTFLL